MSRPSAVYRLIDAAGDPLYIGCSYEPDTRIASHRRTQPWFADVDHVEVEWFDTRREALDAEAAAIVDADPPHNIYPLARPLPPIHGPWMREMTAEDLAAESRRKTIEMCRAMGITAERYAEYLESAS